MKLWLLRPGEAYLVLDYRTRKQQNPWIPEFDKAFGHIVRAETEEDARRIAGANAGEETAAPWHDAGLSTCVELTADGPAGSIMVDLHSS